MAGPAASSSLPGSRSRRSRSSSSMTRRSSSSPRRRSSSCIGTPGPFRLAPAAQRHPLAVHGGCSFDELQGREGQEGGRGSGTGCRLTGVSSTCSGLSRPGCTRMSTVPSGRMSRACGFLVTLKRSSRRPGWLLLDLERGRTVGAGHQLADRRFRVSMPGPDSARTSISTPALAGSSTNPFFRSSVASPPPTSEADGRTPAACGPIFP